MPTKPAKNTYTLHEKVDESPETLRLVFRPGSGKISEFAPGMFVMIRGDGVDPQTGKEYQRKAFSIASDPGAENVELLVIKKPKHGDSTHDSHFLMAKEGDAFVLEGPMGNKFMVPLDTGKKLALFAGGTGIAPFASLLRKEDRVRSGTDINMLYSVKRPEEVLLRRELEDLEKKITLKWAVTVTRPEESAQKWDGLTKRITPEMIMGRIPDIRERECYICGSVEFSNMVEKMLVSLGVPADKIKKDAWG